MSNPSLSASSWGARLRLGSVACAAGLASLASVSAHFVKGMASPELATAFISSPTTNTDGMIPIRWGDEPVGDTGLRVVCFYVANTSPARVRRPEWPRITGVGFELPGTKSGFSLLAPLDGGWEIQHVVDATVGDQTVVLDFAIVARTNATARTPGAPKEPRGIPPGQDPVRGGDSTRFCVSGPFPDALPGLAPPVTIEQLLNGVVVGFRGVEGIHGRIDTGVWFPGVPGVPGPGPIPRAVPLYE
jgi:hypothetical protein